MFHVLFLLRIFYSETSNICLKLNCLLVFSAFLVQLFISVRGVTKVTDNIKKRRNDLLKLV